MDSALQDPRVSSPSPCGRPPPLCRGSPSPGPHLRWVPRALCLRRADRRAGLGRAGLHVQD
eukprot:6252555-Alexandrium_andersonii.AAC.1